MKTTNRISRNRKAAKVNRTRPVIQTGGIPHNVGFNANRVLAIIAAVLVMGAATAAVLIPSIRY